MDQLRELIGASPAIEALRASIRRLVQTTQRSPVY
jgi:hypothetical protein